MQGNVGIAIKDYMIGIDELSSRILKRQSIRVCFGKRLVNTGVDVSPCLLVVLTHVSGYIGHKFPKWRRHPEAPEETFKRSQTCSSGLLQGPHDDSLIFPDHSSIIFKTYSSRIPGQLWQLWTEGLDLPRSVEMAWCMKSSMVWRAVRMPMMLCASQWVTSQAGACDRCLPFDHLFTMLSFKMCHFALQIAGQFATVLGFRGS